jgi:hypothetical protein
MADARDKAHDLLAQCGEALWGPRWQTDMAEALGVSDRTVRRWVAGGRIPPGVFVDLIRIASERSAYLDQLADEMRQVGGGV